MIVTTTPTVEGQPVRDYLGIVTGEVIVGANLVRDLFAAVTDIVGGRSGKYEEVLQRARAAFADPQRILIVRDHHALLRCQARAAVPGLLMGLPAVALTEHADLLHGVYRAEQSVRVRPSTKNHRRTQIAH